MFAGFAANDCPSFAAAIARVIEERREVWIVEHRQVWLDCPGGRGGYYYESVQCHVASTEDKAVAWCRANLDMGEKDSRKPWWFAITRDVVDDPSWLEADNRLQFVYWDGTRGDYQPCGGYEFMRKQMAADAAEKGE